MSKIINLAALTIVLSGAFAAAPSSAQPEPRSVTIRTADLDLATPAGEHALHTRITRAVAWVCDSVDPRDLRGIAASHACRTALLAQAGSRMQTIVSNARSGRGYAANDTKVASAY